MAVGVSYFYFRFWTTKSCTGDTNNAEEPETVSRSNQINCVKSVEVLVMASWKDRNTYLGTDAVNLNHSTIKILEIKYVSNKMLLQKYLAEKNNLRNKRIKITPYEQTYNLGEILTKGSHVPGHKLCDDVNEVFLFHGTLKENIDSILQNGFDLSMARGGLYGSGIYLSDSAQKADQYAGMI